MLSTNSNVPDLRNYAGPGSNVNVNDMISSIQIGRGLKCEFYKDINYKGAKMGPMIHGTYPDLTKSAWNDQISSYKCYPDTASR